MMPKTLVRNNPVTAAGMATAQKPAHERGAKPRRVPRSHLHGRRLRVEGGDELVQAAPPRLDALEQIPTGWAAVLRQVRGDEVTGSTHRSTV